MACVLRLLFGLLVSIVAPIADAAAEKEVVLLFTGDIHGHVEPWVGWEAELSGKTIGGFDRLATVIHKVRQEAGANNVLLLDSGDAIGDTLIAAETKGSAVIRLMNEVGYDAIAIGNHEPDFGIQGLQRLMEQARFPFLAANILTESDKPLSAPFLIKEICDIKIAILGIGYPNTPLTTGRGNVEGLKFNDPRVIVTEWTEKLRAAGANLIVALTHYGLSADITTESFI